MKEQYDYYGTFKAMPAENVHAIIASGTEIGTGIKTGIISVEFLFSTDQFRK